MHELVITQSILEIAVRHASDCQARRITELHIVIGQWASAVDDSVQFYWDLISEGTIAQGAKLHFRRIAPEMHCLDCDRAYAPAGRDLFCPLCGGHHTQIIHGEEFYLESIEVDTSSIDPGAP